MSGMPLQSCGIPSLINKRCGNGALHRCMCLLQIFSGCCQSAKWNRLAQEHLGALEEKPRARVGNLETQHNPPSRGEKPGLTCNTGTGMPTKSTNSGIILVYSLFQGVVLYLKWTNQRKGTKINRLC